MIPIANRFFGVLALVALGIAVVTIVGLVTRRVPARLREAALPLATAIAAVTTAGSLFYSEVAGYPPCTLCWYQRIGMYPLVVVVGIAALRRDRSVWLPAVVLAGLGGSVSVWHKVIELRPELGGACDPTNPCAILWVNEFGVLTMPTMALIAFVAIAALTIAARTPVAPTSTPTPQDPTRQDLR